MSRIFKFAELGSTNADLITRAENGAQDDTWVIAEAQTAGRGRQNRAWISDAGNFYGSVLVRPHGGETSRLLAQLSFVAALAVADALGEFSLRAELKWPNDVLVDSAKIAGILLEAQPSAQRSAWVVVGMGVNLMHAPPIADRGVTCVHAHTGAAPSADEFFAALQKHFNAWRRQWRENGFAALRSAWLARATGLGARCRARLPGREISGIFSGLADDGALLMTLDSGSTVTVHGGEVFGV